MDKYPRALRAKPATVPVQCAFQHNCFVYVALLRWFYMTQSFLLRSALFCCVVSIAVLFRTVTFRGYPSGFCNVFGLRGSLNSACHRTES